MGSPREAELQLAQAHLVATVRPSAQSECREAENRPSQEIRMNAVTEFKPQQRTSLVARMAERFGVDPEKMLTTLKATAFKGDVSNEQMMALLVVAEQHGLNPWTKEIYAFPDRNHGIVPVVGVDGWARIINERKELDGIDFLEAEDGSWIECVIYRKDREHPTRLREWLAECKRDTGPWKSHPRRMLRHKSLIQCARIAFGFGGIYDQDEAERIIEVEPITVRAYRADDEVRGDLSGIDPADVQKHVDAIKELLDQSDKDESAVAQDCRDYVEAYLQKLNELYICVQDQMARDKIITRTKWRKLLERGPLVLDRGETHTA
jgi:phage recombination protein Bet